MPSLPAEAPTSFRTLRVLDTALDKTQDFRAQVEACAEDLGSANDSAKSRTPSGATSLHTAQAPQDGLAVELRVQACADDLQQVTDHLARGLDEVRVLERSLNRSRWALAKPEAGPAKSRDIEVPASQQAMHDPDTGLLDRTLFDDGRMQAIAGAERHRWMLAVMFLERDRFKRINDLHGRAAGNSMLTVVAQRLMRRARDEDTVFRNGIDECLYLLIDPADRRAIARIAGLVRQAIEAPIGLGAQQFVITPIFGIALHPDHGMGGKTLIAHVDAAIYRARQRCSHCEYFEPWMFVGGALRGPPDRTA